MHPPSPITDAVKDIPEPENNQHQKETLKSRVTAFLSSAKTTEEEDDTKHKKPSEAQPPPLPPVTFLDLFSYATRREVCYLIFACVSAAVHGAVLPMFTIVFGSIIDEFGAVTQDEEARAKLVSSIGGIAKWFLILGAIAFLSSFVQVRYALIFSQRVANRVRVLYFTSLMSQDYTWYANVQTGELTSRVSGDVNLLEAGIGDKISSAVQFTTMLITGLIIAFIYGWKLSLVVLLAAPFLMISGALFARMAASGASSTQDAYAAAGAVATEVFSLIRTVTAFNGQETEAKRYDQKLQAAYLAGVKDAALSGATVGFLYFVIFCTFAAAFVFGGFLVRRDEMDPGDIVVTFFSVFIATISIGQGAPAFSAIATARGAAPRVYEVIRRQSDIDPMDKENGLKPSSPVGDIRFEKVKFNYPKRVIGDEESSCSNQFVLDEFELTVKHGSSHALVGASGSGKTSAVRLIERFYDVQHGSVFVDGVDVRDYNVQWLRNQIGYVGQMPTLFMLSIRDNIALGASIEFENEKHERKQVTHDEIVESAKMANAHDFIMKLPQQYDTMLGERGALLSGGQKQRICIARALIRNPKILLFDESTSALDAQSERHVQDALEQASKGRTTITIAHRLSTVKNCDVISVIDNGKVVEEGSHESLMLLNGSYKTLIESQNITSSNLDQDKQIGDGVAESSIHVGRSVTKDKSSTANIVDGKGMDGEDGDKEKEKHIDPGVVKRAFILNKGEWPIIFLGMVGSAMAGAAFPLMALSFSSVLGDLFLPDNEGPVRQAAIFFVIIGCGSLFGNILQFSMLGVSGGRLTRKLRSLSFRALLKQEMGYFDQKENSVGQVTTRLATEATLVQGLTGNTLGSATLVFSTLTTGMIVAFISCWQIAAVLLCIFPLMGVAESIQVKMLAGFDADAGVKFASAGAVASESIDNIDTVTSLGIQDYFINRYEDELKGPLKDGDRKSIISGVSFGFAEFLVQALWAIAFWVGSVFVGQGKCEFIPMMRGISGLLFAGSTLGQTAQFTPDFPKSRVAATKIFRLLDRVPKIVDPVAGMVQRSRDDIKGEIRADGVHFEYPSRPDVPVLKGLSLNVEQGQSIALTGESGSGKSTVIGLIERFYDARAGGIRLDGVDAREWRVNNLRSHLGIVSQEPDLFNRSVKDNIAYGILGDDNDGNLQVVSDEMITEAAMEANAHDFISSLPDGYDTVVGSRGEKLSGGQRQRVAIARSLIRKPKVLLLDEATSALDSVSERVVQKALEKASGGRTTVTIAHRLSTVKNADVICVIGKGRVIESGTHAELMRKNGAYAILVKNQLDQVP